MLRSFRKALPPERIEALEAAVIDAAGARDSKPFQNDLKRLLRAQRHQLEAAQSLLRIVATHRLPIDDARDVLVAVRKAHPGEVDLLALTGAATEAALDLDFPNAAFGAWSAAQFPQREPRPRHDPAYATILTGSPAVSGFGDKS